MAERSTWQQWALDVLERAAEGHAAAQDWHTAIGQARQALGLDPLQERFHRLLMRCLHASGERAAALAHYRSAARVSSTGPACDLALFQCGHS